MLFDAHPQTSWLFDRKTLKVLAGNQAALNRYGYTREAFLNLKVSDLIEAAELTKFLQFADSALGTEGQSLKYHQRARGGTAFYSSVQIRPFVFGETNARLVSVADASESSLSMIQMRMLVEHLPFMVDAFDQDNHVALWNKECERVTGYTFEEMESFPDPMAVLYPDANQRQEMYREYKRRNGHFHNWELTLTAKDGTPRTIAWTNLSTQIEIHGYRVWATGIDVTAARRTHRQLAEKESILAGLADNFPGVAIYQYIQDGTENYYSYISESIESICGISAADLLSGKRRLRELLSEKDIQKLTRMTEEVSQTGGRLEFEVEGHPLGDKDRVWMFRTIVRKLAQGRVIYDGIILDMTEQRRVRLQIENAQKHQTIGVLAGGIAHDFNNLLTTIIGNAQLGQMQVEAGSELDECLVGIVQASERAAGLCQKILTFAGRRMSRKTLLDLNQILSDMQGTLQSILSRKVSLEMTLQPYLPKIVADAGMIDQLLVNLLTNASDSYNGREGVIQVRTTEVERRTEDFLTMPVQESCEAGSYIFLEVADRGCGIAEEHIPRMFEPYFSTKDAGRGLGLAAVQGVVRSLKGAIDVKSQLGKGTSVQVFLPIQRGV